MTLYRSYRDRLAQIERKRVGSTQPVWPLTDADLPSRTHPITVRTEKRCG